MSAGCDEKNLEAFLNHTHPGTKVVVGDGRRVPRSRRAFPKRAFLGPGMFGAELASTLFWRRTFVFPSKTDTFGLVMIEALACGVPVAGYLSNGPIDAAHARNRGDGRRSDQGGSARR